MKNILLLMMTFLVISCDEDNDSGSTVHPLVGTWNVVSMTLEAGFITTEEACVGETYSWINNACMSTLTSETAEWNSITWTFNANNTVTTIVDSEESETTTGIWSIDGNQLTLASDDSDVEDMVGTYSIVNNTLELTTTIDIDGGSYPVVTIFSRG